MSFSSSRALAIVTCLLGACTSLSPQIESAQPRLVTADNQSGIWAAGIALYGKANFLAAADLFQLAYKLKPMRRLDQNIGMAYFKAAHQPEYPEVLRLEYTRRAIPYLKSYRTWLISDYGKAHDITIALADTNQRLNEAALLEQELRARVGPLP